MGRKRKTGDLILPIFFVSALLIQPAYAGTLTVTVLPPPGVPNFTHVGTGLRFDEENASLWGRNLLVGPTNGVHTITDVHPGRWNITVSNGNYYGSVVKAGFDMPAGNVTVPIRVQLPVSKSAQVFGYVRYDHHGGSMWSSYPPMPTLTIENMANGRKIGLQFTYSNGYFVIDDVPAPGTYIFRATHKTTGEAQAKVTLQPGELKRLELITQPPPPPPDPGWGLGGAHGRVVSKDPSGQGPGDLANIEVTVVGTRYKAVTDGKGYYKIPAVIPLGVYDIEARKGNWVGTAKEVKLDVGKLIHFVRTIELKLDNSPKAAPAAPAPPGGRGIRRGNGIVGG